MATKLKSISRQIPWFLTGKAFAFFAGWFILPFWLFIIFASYLYFVPFFHASIFLPAFLGILGLSFFGIHNLWFAFILGALFFILLGIKEFFFIDREAAYETFILLLIFGGLIRFFSYFSEWDSGAALWWSLVFPIFFFWLTLRMLQYFDHHSSRETKEEHEFGKRKIIIGVAAFLFWESILAVLFLPVGFFYQSALAFFIAAILLEMGVDYLDRTLERRRILISFTFLFVCTIFIFAASEWGL